MSSVVVRRFAASPARISSNVWEAITKLVCRGDKNAEAEFKKVAGVASCLINDEAFTNSPMSLKNDGPRLRVYCVYGDDAIAGENVNEAALSWDPTKGDWIAYLPCLTDDFAMMEKSIKGKSAHFKIYDVEKGVPDEEEKAEASAKSENSAVDWEAFKKL